MKGFKNAALCKVELRSTAAHSKQAFEYGCPSYDLRYYDLRPNTYIIYNRPTYIHDFGDRQACGLYNVQRICKILGSMYYVDNCLRPGMPD